VQFGVRLNTGVVVEAADQVVTDVLKFVLELLSGRIGEQLESVVTFARQTHGHHELPVLLAQQRVMRQQPGVELIVKHTLEHGPDARVERETDVDHTIWCFDNRLVMRCSFQTSLKCQC